MLDAFIIEELKKREEQRRRGDRRPVVELPTDEEHSESDYDVDRKDDTNDESQTIIIDFGS
jgi:hypothetical protein